MTQVFSMLIKVWSSLLNSEKKERVGNSHPLL